MAGTKKSPDSLQNLKGIGEKTEKLFNRAGVYTLEDLIRYYPREYDSYEKPVPIREAPAGSKSAVAGRILKKPSLRVFGKNSITMVTLRDGEDTMQVNWFHMPYLRNTLQPGSEYVFRGLVTEKSGRKIMEHPEIFTREAYEKRTGTLLPVYPLTEGLSNRTIRKAVEQLLEIRTPSREYLPDQIREQAGLPEINFALTQIHFPDSAEKLLTARNRLAFDEFFFFLLGVSRMRTDERDTPNHFPMKRGWVTEDVIASLPYKLTKSQEKVWTQIERDLASPHLMNRMIQGDVGSGKTILAFLAMIMAFDNGYQSALMVPTEVLAEQHYQALTELLARTGIENAHPVLLTGSRTAKEKREIDAAIASGEARLIIGTHALIQESVTYRELGLVITDEQHRFGVLQREALGEKGEPPHTLVMSATPIPRTLAMILFGDLDISVLEGLPAGRLPIKNCAVGPSYRETAYRFMEKQIAMGHQVYIICPMVEPNEELACENVKEYTKKVRARFGDEVRIEPLYGSMKPKEKKAVMEAFARGEIQILVSTTVVEVGVNVPNATVMMIENAERFGLAQLHQLRGRVGRGKDQSYCIFLQGDGKKETSKRLEILCQSNDGFYIADEDLKLRGPGDLFGVRQSGIAVFRIADIYRDADMLRAADEAAKALLSLDPDLSFPQDEELKKALEAYTSSNLRRQNDDTDL